MNNLTQYLVDGILQEADEGITVMLPGGFKPPHEGHLRLAKGYEKLPNVKEVVILVGPKDRDGINVEDSIDAWKILLAGTRNISVGVSKYPSPLLTAYKYIEEKAKPGQSYALGSSSKGSDYNRVRDFVDQHQEDGKYYRDDISVVELPLDSAAPLYYKGRSDGNNGHPISASQVRKDVENNDFDNFKTNYPTIKSPKELQAIFDILVKKKNISKEMREALSQSTLGEVIRKVDGKFVVYPKKGGKRLGTHSTEDQAQDQIKAIHANEAIELPGRLSDYIKKLKESYKSFIENLSTEGGETKEAFKLLASSVVKGHKLTQTQRKEIGDQLKDVLKVAGFTAATVLPGGVVYLLLTRVTKLQKHLVPSSFIKEDINVPVNIGDTVLMGRFKNKKVVVKSISKNDKGDLQINGRPALKFRIPKKKESTNEAVIKNYKRGDTIKLDNNVWKVAKVDYKPGTSYKGSFIYKGPDMKPVTGIKTPPITNKNAKGYLLTPQYGSDNAFFYQYIGGVGGVLISKLVTDQFGFEHDYIEPKGGTQSSMFENRMMLNEGGAAGHMPHPYEDIDLTFNEIEAMIDSALSGKVEYAQEKLDGQNLMMTYKDGKALAARKKSQFKNQAETAYTKTEFEKSGAHWPDNVKLSFYEAFNDMAAAMEKLTPAEKEEFFGNGSKFINFEILHPKTPNALAYGVTEIRIHNITEYDKDGNIVGTIDKGSRKLEQALQRVEADKQNTYEIKATELVNLKRTKDYEQQKARLFKELNAVRSRYDLSKKDKLGLYFQNFWSELIKNNAKTYKYNIPDDVLQNLINRWAFGIKKPRIDEIKKQIDNPEFLQWVIDMDKGGGVKQQKKIAVMPVEDIFLKLGIFVLESIEGLLTINPNNVVASTKKELAAAIEKIKAAASNDQMSDDDAPLRFLKAQLQRLEKLGGFKAIVPTEGIVFKHNNKLYKLTGSFAPVNQIIGYIKHPKGR